MSKTFQAFKVFEELYMIEKASWILQKSVRKNKKNGVFEKLLRRYFPYVPKILVLLVQTLMATENLATERTEQLPCDHEIMFM